MPRFSNYGLNRYLCDVLEEMRKCHENRNYAILLSLIDEVQILGNRMEASLSDKKDIQYLHDEIKELKKRRDKLEKEVDKLEEKTDEE